MVKKLNPTLVHNTLLAHKLTIFSPRDICILFKVSLPAARKFIHHYVQKELFIKLRNGLYALHGRQPSPFVVANKLYQPSYLSLEQPYRFINLFPK